MMDSYAVAIMDAAVAAVAPKRADSEPVLHELKSWPQYFVPVLHGLKTFEVRRYDRDYRVGDYLYLREWCPLRGIYTGREIVVRVTYRLVHGRNCLYPASDRAGSEDTPGWCIMSISKDDS